MITIGISTNFDTEKRRINIPNDYITAIIRAGALPVLMPMTDNEAVWRASVDKVDGMVFPGGEDFDPVLFGEEKLDACGEIVPERDKQELYTYHYLLATGKPFLAICRGAQLVNIAQGGTLYQDIPTQYDTQLRHENENKSAHRVEVVEGTLLHKLSGLHELTVNSRHHQAVKDLGKDLRVNAISEDGIIEGIEFTNGYPGLAFQWHPENLAPTQPEMQRLFDWLVREAEKRA